MSRILQQTVCELPRFLFAAPDSRKNLDVLDVSSINPQQYPALYRKAYNETEYAMKLLEHHGYTPKVFCIAEHHDDQSVFEVLSDRWNWIVTPVTLEATPDIPREYLEAIGILADNNVGITGIALAVPVPREMSGEVVWQECVHEMRVLALVAQITCQIIVGIIQRAVIVTTQALAPAQSVGTTAIPDPALLVHVKTIWIEIGRW